MTNKKVSNDGVTHINVYSKGNTELGKFLSNFTFCPIQTEDGPFYSIEGYWYWLSCKNEKLRTLSGYAAKSFGREQGAKDWCDDEEFKRKICDAIRAKLSTPQARTILRQNDHILHLPLEHYYVYGNKINRPKEGQWIIDCVAECIKKYRLDY